MSNAVHPAHLLYTKEHEWLLVEGDTGLVGITHFAQDQLGDVVFVELPTPGRTLKQGEQFGVVESVKTVSDLFMPISCEVLEINPDLDASPELVNSSPYEQGWMVKVKLTNPAEKANLLSAAEYIEFIKVGG